MRQGPPTRPSWGAHSPPQPPQGHSHSHQQHGAKHCAGSARGAPAPKPTGQKYSLLSYYCPSGSCLSSFAVRKKKKKKALMQSYRCHGKEHCCCISLCDLL